MSLEKFKIFFEKKPREIQSFCRQCLEKYLERYLVLAKGSNKLDVLSKIFWFDF